MKAIVWIAACLCLLSAASCHGCTWYITADGTGDAPTIQAGIDSAAAGDTVLVACGTYYESGIYLDFSIALLSESGTSACATIDAQWNNTVLVLRDCDSTTVVRGFALTHGSPKGPPPGEAGGMTILFSSPRVIDCTFLDNDGGNGGAVYCGPSAPIFTNCIFDGNFAGYGSAICCFSADATIAGCEFIRNEAAEGTVYCVDCAPTIIGCTFFGNSAESGGGLFCSSSSAPTVENTIITYSTSGGAVACEGATAAPSLCCCNIYSNTGGDWAGCIAEQSTTNGNFSADPLFCDTTSTDLSLEDCSPCHPGNHPQGYDWDGIIGACGQGCGCGTVTEPATWGGVKSLFR